MPPGGDDELVLRASVQDEATAPLDRIDRKLDDVGNSAAAAGRKAGTAGAAGLTRMEIAGQKLHNGLTKLDSRLLTVSRTVGGAFTTGLRRGALALGVITGAAGLFGVKAASTFQATGIAFETMLGSVERGQALFRELQAMNLRTPFELKDLAAGEQLLLRYNIAADRSVGILKGLSDVAALSDDPTGNLNAMARAVGQIFTSGRLQGQDALQLVQAGINAYDVYAKKLGITQAAARKLGEEGKLDANILLDAITNLDGGLEKFRGGAEKMSHTLLGQWSNLKDAINVGLAGAATPLVDAMSAQIGTPDKPGPLIGGIMALINGAGPPLFAFLGTLVGGISRLVPIVEPILTAIATGLDRLFTAAGPAMSMLEPLGGEIGDSLVELVDALVPVMPDLVYAFVQLVEVLPEFVRLLAALVPIIGPIARLTGHLLEFRPIRGIMAGLLGVLLGYRALHGVIGGMLSFAKALKAIAAGEAAVSAAETGGTVAGAASTAGKVGILSRLAGLVPEGAAAATGGALLRGGLVVGGTYATIRAADIIERHIPGYETDEDWVTRGGPTMGGPSTGDHPELKYGGDLPRRHARTLGVDHAVDRMTPGYRALTSSVRHHHVLSAASGHVDGTAVDRAGSFMGRYRQNVLAAGGWAAQHGNHVHADYGDLPRPSRPTADMPAASSGAGARTLVVHGNVIGVDDLRGMWERWNRDLDDQDRHRHRKVQR